MTPRRHGFDSDINALDAAAHGYWLHQAMNEIAHQRGDRVSTELRQTSQRKFGRTLNADTGDKTTVAVFQGAVINETYATTNSIDTISSDNDGDTQVIVIQGYVLDVNNDMVFVSQEVTLTGQTEAPLDTNLARVDRAHVKAGTFASPSVTLAGNVFIYDNVGGSTTGTPTVASATRLVIEAGVNQSQKAALTVAATDYLIVRGMDASITRGAATSNADIEIEWREQGGVWRPSGAEIALRTAATNASFVDLTPFIWFPPNSDVRVVAVSTADNTNVRAHIDGILATITGTV